MGNAAKVTEIYHELSDGVHKYIYYMVKDPWIAEDLTQETFIRVLHHLDGFSAEASMKTWIFKIARNIALDYLRRKKLLQFLHIESLFKSLKTDDAPLVDGLVMSEEVAALYEGLDKLKREYREVIILRKINELSTRESAAILNWSDDKVKSMLSRGLSKLRAEMLQKRGVGNEFQS